MRFITIPPFLIGGALFFVCLPWGYSISVLAAPDEVNESRSVLSRLDDLEAENAKMAKELARLKDQDSKNERDLVAARSEVNELKAELKKAADDFSHFLSTTRGDVAKLSARVSDVEGKTKTLRFSNKGLIVQMGTGRIFAFQDDGNAVVYSRGRAVWSTGTFDK